MHINSISIHSGSSSSEEELARILKRIPPQEMWNLYINWIRGHDVAGLITHKQLAAFLTPFGWTYLEMRNALHPELYGKRR